jgi:hypothetical protein
MCEGFLTVEFVLSPKNHFHEVGDPVLLSVNVTFSDACPERGDAEKEATGFFLWSLDSYIFIYGFSVTTFCILYC